MSHRATFGKNDVPELGNPPHNGEDDAFSDQNTEHIRRNQSTILARVEKFIGLGLNGGVNTDEIKENR